MFVGHNHPLMGLDDGKGTREAERNLPLYINLSITAVS